MFSRFTIKFETYLIYLFSAFVCITCMIQAPRIQVWVDTFKFYESFYCSSLLFILFNISLIALGCYFKNINLIISSLLISMLFAHYQTCHSFLEHIDERFSFNPHMPFYALLYPVATAVLAVPAAFYISHRIDGFSISPIFFHLLVFSGILYCGYMLLKIYIFAPYSFNLFVGSSFMYKPYTLLVVLSFCPLVLWKGKQGLLIISVLLIFAHILFSTSDLFTRVPDRKFDFRSSLLVNDLFVAICVFIYILVIN